MAERSFFSRHPVLTLLGVNVAVLIFLLLAAEGILRIYVPRNLGYYAAITTTESELVYPYGKILINSDGYPDAEFGRDEAPRIGYFGDSVTYGVGAGYGHRFSELLEERFPEYEHLNFAGVGTSPTRQAVERMVETAERFGIDHALLFFNLNDILPTLEPNDRAISRARRLRDTLDRLRGHSYLYTWVRTRISQSLLRGDGGGLKPMPELHPNFHRPVFQQTASRVTDLWRALDVRGIEMTLILLPYEMQISAEAERAYRDAGVKWQAGFVDRSAQKMLRRSLPSDLRTIDAYWAFVDREDEEASRQANGLGEFFVYDEGGSLDWNHPNRAGHRAIARYLAEIPLLPSGDAASIPASAASPRTR